MKKIIFVMLLICVFALGCSGKGNVVINNEKINIETVDTPGKMEQGLMYRDSLCHDCGMLFVFDKEDTYLFWMKNTYIPLEIIFIDSDKKVVDVLEAEPCFKEPCEIYTPSGKALYVIEVNKDRFGQEIIGQKIKIN